MVKAFKILSALIFLCSAAFAQFTTVSGTVTDPNNLPYAYGTITPQLVTNGATPTLNGFPYSPPVLAVGLDATGSFTMQLAQSAALGGLTWNFKVCSAGATVQPAFGKGPVCFSIIGITISGSSQSLTSTLTAAALPLTASFSGGSGLPLGCSNGQTTTFNGTSWTCSNAGTGTITGGGTSNFLPLFSSATGLANSPISTTGTVLQDTTQPFNVTGITSSNGAILGNATPTACPGGGVNANFNTNLFNVGCLADGFTMNPPAATSGVAPSVRGINQYAVTLSGTPALAGVFGLGGGGAGAGGSPSFVVGVAGQSNVITPISGTVANAAGLLGIGSIGPGGSQPATKLYGVYGQCTNDSGGNGNVTQPFCAALYAAPPEFSSGGTPVTSNVYGLYVDDQTAGGSTQNPSPGGIFTNGTAPSSFGGPLTLRSGSLIISSLGTGTSAVCPNGSGGALTTAGCISTAAFPQTVPTGLGSTPPITGASDNPLVLATQSNNNAYIEPNGTGFFAFPQFGLSDFYATPITPGADASIKAQALLTAAQAANGFGARLDLDPLGSSLTFSENPFPAGANTPASGVLHLPAGLISVATPVVNVQSGQGHWLIEGISGQGQSSNSTRLQANASSFPVGCAACGGSATISAESSSGSSVVVASSAAAFTAAMASAGGGCEVSSPSGGAANMWRGSIATFTSSTQVTINRVNVLGAGTSSPSTFDVTCSIVPTDLDAENVAVFASQVKNMVLDANNLTGVIPYTNLNSQELSRADNLSLLNFTDYGFGIFAQNFGPAFGLNFCPGASANANTVSLVDSVNGGTRGEIGNLTSTKCSSATRPLVHYAAGTNNRFGHDFHFEDVAANGFALCLGCAPTLNVPAPSPHLNAHTSTWISIDCGGNASASLSTCIGLDEINGTSVQKGVNILGVDTSSAMTNALKDGFAGNTLTQANNSFLGFYQTDAAGGVFSNANPADPGLTMINAYNDNLEFLKSGTVEAQINGTTGTVTGALFQTTTKCAAIGTAANPSVASCTAAAAGMVSCSTSASTGTCSVTTTAVTANSTILVQQRTDTTAGTTLSVTCNTTKDTNSSSPQITAVSAGASFTFQLGTFSLNPECFNYSIVN